MLSKLISETVIYDFNGPPNTEPFIQVRNLAKGWNWSLSLLYIILGRCYIFDPDTCILSVGGLLIYSVWQLFGLELRWTLVRLGFIGFIQCGSGIDLSRKF